MKLLFLGGTQFVGRHMVAEALARGHSVTLFNRGKTNAGLFPQAEQIIGDRDGNLNPLRGRRWDAVIDVNGYVPRLVKDSANLLKDAVGQYVFVSTGSVYDLKNIRANEDENGPLTPVEDPDTEDWNGPAYGWLKVLCEQAVEEIYPGRHFTLRLGVVAGPYDPTDRITYWVARVARGGEVLVPGQPESPIQFIDARDLADFTLLGVERGLNGIYNTTGNSIRWGCFLDACQQASRSDAVFTYVDDFDFISSQIDLGAKDFGTVPMSLPPAYRHVRTMNNDKALADGLVYRATLNTARDILAWERTRDSAEKRVAGLDPTLESEVLRNWHARG